MLASFYKFGLLGAVGRQAAEAPSSGNPLHEDDGTTVLLEDDGTIVLTED